MSAPDAADRLLLDESAEARAGRDVVVIGDGCSPLAVAVAAAGAREVRVHQDALTGEQELAGAERVRSLPLNAELVRGAEVVLVRLPRSLEALRDIAGLVAAHAAPDVVVYAGGRIKHMTVAMNDVLRERFRTVDVTHARQKSRVLVARGPHDGADPVPARAKATIEGYPPLIVCALGGVFAGARVDIGTRMLLSHLPADLAGGTAQDPWIDLACGSGVVATALALRHPSAYVYGSDRSAAAVASASATAAANGVADRATFRRDDALRSRDADSASFVALNPPFHDDAAITTGIASRLFADAARVLRPGGQLWCVWNSPLRYRGELERLVGPTAQVARNAKFTVTVSTRR